jgi:uncharacterized protein YceH (UPF0502 family)
MLPNGLSPIDVRVLACLIKKELSTPDHHPLSLNAFTSACNQLSNRRHRLPATTGWQRWKNR